MADHDLGKMADSEAEIVLYVISPFVLFFFLGRLRGVSLHSSVFSTDVHWLIVGFFFLLVHVLQVIVFVVSSCLVFDLNAVKFDGVFFVIQTHVLAK